MRTIAKADDRHRCVIPPRHALLNVSAPDPDFILQCEDCGQHWWFRWHRQTRTYYQPDEKPISARKAARLQRKWSQA